VKFSLELFYIFSSLFKAKPPKPIFKKQSKGFFIIPLKLMKNPAGAPAKAAVLEAS